MVPVPIFVTISISYSAVPNLARDDSMAGRGVGLTARGGFPNNFVLTFDAPEPLRRDNVDGG